MALLFCFGATFAQADGGHVALRATSGAYSITLFTAPEPLVSGPVDLSLLVEDAASGEVLSDVTASGSLAPAGGPETQITFTREAASNKLLLAATPTLEAPGTYTLVFHVEQPERPPSSFRVQLSVAANHRRRTTLLFALILPLAVILLFLVNQQAKLQRGPRPSALH